MPAQVQPGIRVSRWSWLLSVVIALGVSPPVTPGTDLAVGSVPPQRAGVVIGILARPAPSWRGARHRGASKLAPAPPKLTSLSLFPHGVPPEASETRARTRWGRRDSGAVEGLPENARPVRCSAPPSRFHVGNAHCEPWRVRPSAHRHRILWPALLTAGRVRAWAHPGGGAQPDRPGATTARGDTIAHAEAVPRRLPKKSSRGRSNAMLRDAKAFQRLSPLDAPAEGAGVLRRHTRPTKVLGRRPEASMLHITTVMRHSSTRSPTSRRPPTPSSTSLSMTSPRR